MRRFLPGVVVLGSLAVVVGEVFEITLFPKVGTIPALMMFTGLITNGSIFIILLHVAVGVAVLPSDIVLNFVFVKVDFSPQVVSYLLKGLSLLA